MHQISSLPKEGDGQNRHLLIFVIQKELPMKYLFGPVPSRRLGISLGVDIVPHKVCTLNCVYCEVGKTTNLTLKRREYVPIAEVIAELDSYLSQGPDLDYITFSGQGEPTLNSGLGEIISFLKAKYLRYKVAILTNGTLFWDKGLRAEVLPADVILPDLDAISELTFKKINRPHKDLKNEDIINGLIALRNEFQGKIYLEVFLVPGINDTPAEQKLLKKTLLQIAPDLVQLNSLDRPGTEAWVKPCSEDCLQDIARDLSPLNVEIVAKAQSRKKIQSFNQSIEKEILATIKRRPCTDQDLCAILNLHQNELNKYLSQMLNEDMIEALEMDRGVFFRIKN
jgi:wyosine [tRNA(Phe)-imidazoG37] synthetase (radical SAM superfamily)